MLQCKCDCFYGCMYACIRDGCTSIVGRQLNASASSMVDNESSALIEITKHSEVSESIPSVAGDDKLEGYSNFSTCLVVDCKDEILY